MDTPEKTQIVDHNPISNFDDSPVFSYINNLSPIKPVKSIHVTQTFGSLAFSSLPSIFASPQVNSHKESRFLRRHRDLDLENAQDRLENEKKTTAIDSVTDTPGQNKNEEELQGNYDGSINVGETSVDPVDISFEFVIKLPQTLKYDRGSPNCDLTSPETHADCVAQTPDDAHLQERTENRDSENKWDTEGIPRQKGGPVQYSLDGSDSKSTDVLIFSSPNNAIAFRGLIQTSPNLSTTGLLASMGSNASQYEIRVASEERQLLHQVTSGEQYETEDPSFLPSEAHFSDGNSQTKLDECLNEGEGGDVKARVPFGYKMSGNLHRCVRRRCLDFKAAETLRKSCDSSLALQVNDNKSSKDKRVILVKQGMGSSKKPILPGIGLHLNALTSSEKTIKQETILPDASSQVGKRGDHENFNPLTSENEMDPAVNGHQLTEDDPTHASMTYEELNQLSPRKMRRRDLNGEPGACKRCNCKKSKCLKLYCECFAAGVYCIEPCACQDCLNKPFHEETVLVTRKQIESRNPLAFAPKVIRASDSVSEVGDESNKTPASARHKRGCNCKKSNCLKKYCECFQGGVGCSINCRCEGCKNVFGTKYGTIMPGADCEMEGDSNCQTIERNDSLLSKPSKLNTPALPMGFPPKTKQLRSSLLNVGVSSSFHPNQRIGGSGSLGPLSNFDRQPLQTNLKDDIPDILCGNTPSIGIIKVTSPNGKRVSILHADSLPGQRSSGRRLILRSIPAFPSLAPHD